MEAHKMFQNVLLAEYHGTFHDTPSNQMAAFVNISAQILLHILGFVFCTECHILAPIIGLKLCGIPTVVGGMKSQGVSREKCPAKFLG
jgi:hypothetical protein